MKRARRVLVGSVLLLGAQYALVAGMARASVVHALLSAGAHTPLGDLAMAGTFLLTRLVTLVVLPSVLVAWTLWAQIGRTRRANLQIGDERQVVRCALRQS
jgi:uncharacterized membrane protein